MSVNSTQQVKRGTAALWTSSNPTLDAGQIGYETDARKIKIGDGVTAWNSLLYYGTTSTNPDGTQVDFKDSVQIVITTNVTQSGEQTLDGVLTSASRVLCAGQTNGAQNGWFLTAAGAWSRTTDADTNAEVTSGALVVVEEGTVGAGLIYKLATPNPIVVGTTSLTFVTENPPTFFFTNQANNALTSYTLKANDSGKRRVFGNASLVTVTIPTHATTAMPNNTEIQLYALGAAGILVTGPSGGTLNSVSGGYIPKGYVAKLKKRAANTWDMTGIPAPYCIAFACSDLSTALTTGTTKGYANNPYSTPFIPREVVASLDTAQASGSIFTVDINEGSGTGTSILSTKLTIDNTETVGGSAVAAGAATPAVISDSSIAAYGRITADIDQIGNGTAKGLVVYVLGYPTA